MGMPRLLLLKQLVSSNSTLQSVKTILFNKLPTTKPHLNSPFFQIRTLTEAAASSDSFHSEIFNFVSKSPKSSVTPLLDRCHEKGNGFVNNTELRKVIRKLRRQKRLNRALEVSEWMMSRTLTDPTSGDLACQLSLIGKVHGVDAAERFFNEVDVHSEKMYGALLNCYVEAKLVDTSLSHFKKMKDMGILTSALSYNNIMTLHVNAGQHEKVPELLSEMEENSVSPDNFSYRICLKSLAMTSDFSTMEKILRKMERQHDLNIEWLTYFVTANYYIEGGVKEKAHYYLQQAENRLDGISVRYNNLITTYAKIGDLNQVMALWRRRKIIDKANTNADYMAMIDSLVKLDEFEEAEKFLQEWESCCSFYDFRVVNVLLLGYAQKGLVEEAERLLEGIICRRMTPIPDSWSIVCAGHIKCQNMPKALQCLKKALELGLVSQRRGWLSPSTITSSILQWLGDNGEIRDVDGFLKLLSRAVPMNEEMYHTLLRANIRLGNDIDSILQRMKADNIDINEETREMIASKTAS